MIVSGYSLDLYCDRENPDHAWNEFPHDFSSESKRVCFKAALAAGWIIKRDGTAICPKCSGKRKQREATHD